MKRSPRRLRAIVTIGLTSTVCVLSLAAMAYASRLEEPTKRPVHLSLDAENVAPTMLVRTEIEQPAEAIPMIPTTAPRFVHPSIDEGEAAPSPRRFRAELDDSATLSISLPAPVTARRIQTEL